MALKIMPESIDLSDYEVVKHSAFMKQKPSVSDEPVTQESFADQWNRVMIFDYGGKGTVTFTGGCLEALEDPDYALVLIHPEKKLLVLMKREKGVRHSDQPKGCKVEKNEAGAWVMEGCSVFLAKMADMMDWHPCGGTQMLFSGELIEGKVVFQLSKAIMFTTGSAEELADYIVNNAAGMTAD